MKHNLLLLMGSSKNCVFTAPVGNLQGKGWVIRCALMLSIALISCNFATHGNKIETYSNPHKALLVMDVQKDFVGIDAKMPVAKDEVDSMIANINGITARLQANGNIVIYIRNVFPRNDIANLFRNNAAVENTDGIAIDDRVKQLSDNVFDKAQPDAFSNKSFERFLIDNRINEITVTGVFADQCVYWTSVSALNRGYKVNFMKNGVAAAKAGDIEKAASALKDKGANVFDY
jgi:nicotinamidase-related amidase